MDRCELELDGHILRIRGALTVYTAAQVKSDFLALPQPSVLDLEGVTQIDWAGVQILAAIKQTARKTGRSLSLEKHSAAVLRLFDLMGLAGWFADRIRIPAGARDEFPFRYGNRRAKP
jgi:anti-sigma B factor antagonist